jgi:hypothetical protein
MECHKFDNYLMLFLHSPLPHMYIYACLQFPKHDVDLVNKKSIASRMLYMCALRSSYKD